MLIYGYFIFYLIFPILSRTIPSHALVPRQKAAVEHHEKEPTNPSNTRYFCYQIILNCELCVRAECSVCDRLLASQDGNTALQPFP